MSRQQSKKPAFIGRVFSECDSQWSLKIPARCNKDDHKAKRLCGGERTHKNDTNQYFEGGQLVSRGQSVENLSAPKLRGEQDAAINLAFVSFILYTTYMKVLSTTNARKNIKEIVNRARYRGEVFAIGRRNVVDAVLIGFPQCFNDQLNDITNANAYSRSFDFLANEPELYSVSDLKKRYV